MISPERLRIAELENELDKAKRKLRERIKTHPYTANDVTLAVSASLQHERARFTAEEQQAANEREREFDARRA